MPTAKPRPVGATRAPGRIKGLRPLPPTPVERMDRGSLNRTSATELPAPTEKQCGRFKLDVQRQRQYFCER